MAQTRYHNYNRPVASLDENFRILGDLFPGVKCGFDTLAPVAGNTISLAHDLSGVTRTELAGTISNKMGCVVTRQGLYIYEDEAIQVNVDFNASGNWRVDLLILQHSTLASAGGALATYSVIKGAENAVGVLPPALSYPVISAPAIQVPIGYIFVPAGAVDHTGTKFIRFKPTLSGKTPFLKNDQEVVALDNTIPLNSNFNYIHESGLYFINTATNAPSTATTEWFVIVMKKGVMIVQFAQAKTSGKSYSRGSLDGVTWQPWSNLNNSDITTSITDLETAIGNRLYSENNFVVDEETVTASIDKLDIEVKDLDDLYTAAAVSISNLSASIGNQSYTENNYIADGESITASLDKLDIALKDVSDVISALDVSNTPWRTDVVWAANWGSSPSIAFGFKIVNNVLYFKGDVRKTIAANSGETVFTLPVDARVTGDFLLIRLVTGPLGTGGANLPYVDIFDTGVMVIGEMGVGFSQPLFEKGCHLDGVQIPLKYN